MKKLMWLLVVAISLPAVGCQSCFESIVSMEQRKNEWLRETLYGSRRRECNSCGGQSSGMPMGGEMMMGESMYDGQMIDGQMIDGQMLGGQFIGGQVIGAPLSGGCQSCGH